MLPIPIGNWVLGIINAYAKFAGDNSAMERAAKAREKPENCAGFYIEIDK